MHRLDGENQRMRMNVLFLILLISILPLFSVTQLASAQSRSEREIIFGTANNDIAMDMALDSTGSVIVVGRSEVSLDPSAGKFYAVKVSSSGETLWTKLWNVTTSDILTGVAIDSQDNILMIGACNLTTDNVFGVVYKFDPNGIEMWSVQIDNINFEWWSHYELFHYCLDIQMHPSSDEFFIAGSVDDGQCKLFTARYSSSGTLEWYSDWFGPPEYNGSIANLMWLSSQNITIIAGFSTNEIDYYPRFDIPFLTAFDFNGTQLWNCTTREYSAAFEFDENEYICATYAGRFFDHVVRCTYDFDEIWNFDMIIDDRHSVVISGFLKNGTNNLIGYGDVTTLTAGSAVIKSYSPAYQAPQPPQTLIFSFTAEGELLWYDYLVLGRISSPCGCQFDSDNRLVIAGHTSIFSFDTCDFYIVFGFVQTPFPTHYDYLAIFIIPTFNLLGLSVVGGIVILRPKHVSSPVESHSKLTLFNSAAVFFVSELVLSLVLNLILIGPFGPGGPPPPLTYYPLWVRYFLSGLTFGLIIPGMILLLAFFRKRRMTSSIEPSGNPID